MDSVILPLVPGPHYCAWPIRFGSRDPSEFLSRKRPRNALTEEACKDAVQGLGKVLSTERKYGKKDGGEADGRVLCLAIP